MIEVTNLRRSYGEFIAVDDVSFSIGPGEIVGLLGHNGAGKTTIMKMLTGFLQPSSGHVSVAGVDVAHDPLTVQAQIGYLPENSPLYPELTVLDYLAHAAELRGCDPARSVPRAIAATQLEAKAGDVIGTLSRGYKQRVGVAQAILHQPKVLILDEPSNGLDPTQIQHMRALIKSLAATTTIILSTHILQEVSAVCERVVILRSGRLVLDGQLAQLQSGDQLRLRTAPDTDATTLQQALAHIEGLDVAPAGNDAWRLSYAGGLDAVAPEIVQRLVTAGIGVIELAQSGQDLESVFAQLSEQEVTDAA